MYPAYSSIPPLSSLCLTVSFVIMFHGLFLNVLTYHFIRGSEPLLRAKSEWFLSLIIPVRLIAFPEFQCSFPYSQVTCSLRPLSHKRGARPVLSRPILAHRSPTFFSTQRPVGLKASSATFCLNIQVVCNFLCLCPTAKGEGLTFVGMLIGLCLFVCLFLKAWFCVGFLPLLCIFQFREALCMYTVKPC